MTKVWTRTRVFGTGINANKDFDTDWRLRYGAHSGEGKEFRDMVRQTNRSLEQDAYALTPHIRLRHKHIVLKINIHSRRLKQFLMITSAENHGQCQVQLRFCKSGNVSVRKLHGRDKQYFIPTHCLDPLENETRYFSSGGAPSGLFSSQRSGLNSWESGNMVSLWWM